jgi:PAS domain S-box-containing protein
LTSSSRRFDATEIPVEPGHPPAEERGNALLRDILRRTGEVGYRYRLWPTLGYEFISDSVFDLLGYTPADFYADPTLPDRIVYPDDRELMQRVLETPGGQQIEVNLRWIRRDGRVVSAELRCVLTRDADGRPLWMDGVARDVTDREADRQRLQLIQWRGAAQDPGRTTRRARVLIADEQELTRAGLRLVLAQDPGLEQVGETADGRETIRLAQMLEPDVALVDVHLPGLGGLETIRRLKTVSPMTSVLLLSMSVDGRLLLEAVKCGAAGYILKDANESALRSAIWEVLNGDLAVDQQLAREVLRQLAADAAPTQPVPDNLLSAREHEVLRLLARGYTNREIAEALTVTPSTIKIHVEHILAKLGVSDRTQAAVRAIELGYVVTEPRRP